MNYYALIVAGGTGSRMQSRVPKQFLLLNGRPVMMHTIEAFHRSGFQPQIILVLHPDLMDHWEDLCQKYEFSIPLITVAGGTNRFESVKNGLKAISGEGLIAVHDAVRPVVSAELIRNAYQAAEQFGAAIPAVPSKDSVRQGREESSRAVNREEIFLVQTPQTFRSSLLRNAYQQSFSEAFTDDASVVEQFGEKIRIIEGDPANIKITFPDDLLLAEFYLNRQN